MDWADYWSDPAVVLHTSRNLIEEVHPLAKMMRPIRSTCMSAGVVALRFS